MKRALLVLLVLVGCSKSDKAKDKEAPKPAVTPDAAGISDMVDKLEHPADPNGLRKEIEAGGKAGTGGIAPPAGESRGSNTLTPEDEEIIQEVDEAELKMSLEELAADLAALDKELDEAIHALDKATTAEEVQALKQQIQEMRAEKAELQAKRAELEVMQKKQQP